MRFKVIAQATADDGKYQTVYQLPTFWVEAAGEREADLLAKLIMLPNTITKQTQPISSLKIELDIVEDDND